MYDIDWIKLESMVVIQCGEVVWWEVLCRDCVELFGLVKGAGHNNGSSASKPDLVHTCASQSNGVVNPDIRMAIY